MATTFNATKARTLLPALLICLLAPAAASAQDNPLSTWNKFAYGHVKTILIRSAEKMPEADYTFKPTAAVRSYGQIIGHIADTQYMFCALVLGEKDPDLKIEQTKTSKPELVAALKDSLAYCDRAYNGMTDASAAQTVKLFGTDTPKLSALTANQMHTLEHYGNLVTYMRLKNIIPPSSEPGATPRAKN
jgi:uncharacterized damage-inducible protein DinB